MRKERISFCITKHICLDLHAHTKRHCLLQLGQRDGGPGGGGGGTDSLTL